MEIFENNIELINSMKSGKYGIFLAVISPVKRKFAREAMWIGKNNLSNDFRFMKTCVFNYYISFAFQKHSPYTALFDYHIIRYMFNIYTTR